MPDPFFATTSKKRKRTESDKLGEPATKRKPVKTITNGRKAGTKGTTYAKATTSSKETKRNAQDEDLESDSASTIGSVDLRRGEEEEESGEEDEDETPAEKRLRLAKLYLEGVKDELAEGEYDAAEIDREIINDRLRKDVLEHSGKVHLFVADKLHSTSRLVTKTTTSKPSSHHRLSLTAATLTEDCRDLFTSSKDGVIMRWSLDSEYTNRGRRISLSLIPQSTILKRILPKGQPKTAQAQEVQGHWDEVWCLAVSGDGKLLVTGSKDRRICVWDISSPTHCKFLKAFNRHRDSVSAAGFRKKTNQLFTASFDRTINVYDLSPHTMGYVETLFGHQDKVLGLDSLRGDFAVSCGGRDKTARWWKIADETQLVFRGGGKTKGVDALDLDEEDLAEQRKPKSTKDTWIEGCIESVAMVDDSTFLTGGDSGAISLWNIGKKKPIFTHALAHGFNVVYSETEGEVKTPRWITALASMRYSDLFVSGSWDGDIRIWKLDGNLKSFKPLHDFAIPCRGVINSLQVLSLSDSHPWATVETQADSDSPVGRTRLGGLLVAGVGQEMRTGRWIQVKENGAKNCAMVVGLEFRL